MEVPSRKGDFMTTPVEVHFHGVEKSEAIEQRVREKVAKLEKHFGRMTSCRVGIEVPQRTAQQAQGLPDQDRDRRAAPQAHRGHATSASAATTTAEELGLAIRDAFEAALRKVDGMVVKISQRSKLERGRRRPRQVQATSA